MKIRFAKNTSLIAAQNLAFVAFVAFYSILTISCSSSSTPAIEELVVTNPPTLGGALDRSYISASPIYVVEGECDPISYGLEWSFSANGTYTDIPGGCPAGHFSISALITPRKDIYVRSRTKTGTTASAHAFVRFVPAPTSPLYAMVQASNSSEEGQRGHQSVMGLSFTGVPMNNGTRKMATDIPGITYQQYGGP